MRRTFIYAVLGAVLFAGALLSQTAPQNPHGKLKWDCQDCHTSESWSALRQPLNFNHDETGYHLMGGHGNAQCIGCHKDLMFNHVGTACIDCHPDHHAGQLGLNCQNCHTTLDWQGRKDLLQLHSERGFPLTGAHAVVDCEACHSGQQEQEYSSTPHDCEGCHGQTFTLTTNPVHVDAGFSIKCEECHHAASGTWANATYTHPSAFPLVGAHQIVDCNGCHKGNYKTVTASCYSPECHQTDFDTTSSPGHTASLFPHDCIICHSMSAWRPASYNHALTGFALTGKHADPSVTCEMCHNGPTPYTNTSSACYSCHQAAFQGVADPNHVTGNYDHNCSICHSTTAWTPATFDHSKSTFPLTGAHVSVTCTACHTTGFVSTPTDCYSCHPARYQSAAFHSGDNLSHDCRTCHNTAAWSPSTFDHSTSVYPLVGAHQSVACGQCHTTSYVNTTQDCYACHATQYNNAQDHVAQSFPHNCLTTGCHNMNSFGGGGAFSHVAATGFALTGAHTTTTCISCHTAGYVSTSAACASCHQPNYLSTANPNHATNNFSQSCEGCHSTTAWTPSTFDHAKTTFPLTGTHATITCISCHASGYTAMTATCYSCHQADFAGTTSPNHTTNNFSQTCTTCHTTTAWIPSTFNHATTVFPLTGAHITATCISCHGAGYTNTPTTCYACHQADFTGTTSPNHSTNNFSQTCTTCHTTTAWIPSTFNHATTVFPLTGAHLTATCISCHGAGYTNTPTTCYACHQADFTSAANPNHVSNNFSHVCTTCHTTAAWSPATFDHSATPFPLTGAHATQTCIACHASGYNNTSPACYSCHQADFTGAANPNHVSNNFSQVCSTCHTTTVWSPATFDHSTTPFPLTGAHATQTCIACHASGYNNTSPACYSCHQADFTGAASPSHVSNNFSQVCTTCHNTTAWIPSTFNHATTIFPLTGAHTTATCISCHGAGYTNTPTACYSCHQADFTGAANPNHVSNNFSHTCSTCHTTTAWSPATFDHSTTPFPLTGAHTSLTCIACHASGYNNTPTACYSCHKTDYDGTTNPNHAAANFPTTCATCHSTTNWTSTTWNHDSQYFRIYSGRHLGQWSLCSDCHTVASDFTSFECILCHSHSKSSTDNSHSGVKNYQYLSTACFSCHPRV
jgi:nitrate/TMAO reductase-like tetraheme cytochrome c subunit